MDETEAATELEFKNDSHRFRFYASLYRAFKHRGCVRCDERDSICIEAHHINPPLKSFNLSPSLLRKPYPTVHQYMAELAKCVPLCGNCHKKEHRASRERLRREREKDMYWFQQSLKLNDKSGWRPPK